MILFDVDGVLTNGSIFYDETGNELKEFNVHDGMGITLAKDAGLFTGIITGRESFAVKRRFEELGVNEICQNSKNKIEAYNEIKFKYGLLNQQIAFVGDDIQDIPVLSVVGLPCCVKNSTREIKKVAKIITSCKGGEGAVREIINIILLVQVKK